MRKWNQAMAGMAGGIVFLLAAISYSLSVGSADIPLLTVWKVILFKLSITSSFVSPDWDAASEAIIMQIRVPRALLAALTGLCLTLAGIAYQGILRNPLAEPYVMGVSSGASLGAAVTIFFGWQTVLDGWVMPLLAFTGGVLSLLLVFRLARLAGNMHVETLILSGVVIQAFFGSLLSFIISISSDQEQRGILYWLMGSFSLADYQQFLVLLPYAVVAYFVLWVLARQVNILALGEQQAVHLGLHLSALRWTVLGISSLAVAAAVSVSGIIGFVGLVVPHMLRRMFGADHRWLYPLGALWGAAFLVTCDTFARTLLEPKELPIGVITAFIGAPFFAYLLYAKRRSIQ